MRVKSCQSLKVSDPTNATEHSIAQDDSVSGINRALPPESAEFVHCEGLCWVIVWSRRARAECRVAAANPIRPPMKGWADCRRPVRSHPIFPRATDLPAPITPPRRPARRFFLIGGKSPDLLLGKHQLTVDGNLEGAAQRRAPTRHRHRNALQHRLARRAAVHSFKACTTRF